LSVGFLRCHEVAAGSFAFSFCGTLVSSDVTETLRNRLFMDLGGTFVGNDKALDRCAVKSRVDVGRRRRVG